MDPLPPPRVIGHRGAAAHAPENTLAGFRAARALGARWVEFDVQATRDGHAILLHDARLERTTNGYGVATQRSLAEIERLDAGRWFGRTFAGEPVPRLEAALALLDDLGLGAIVEIKVEPGDGPRTMRAALAALGAADPARIVLSSFDEPALELAAAEAPRFSRALLFKTVPPDWRRRVARLGCAAVHVGERGLDTGTARALAACVPCRAYTVNKPDRARDLLAWGLGGVFTDCPDVILSAIGPLCERPAQGALAGEQKT